MLSNSTYPPKEGQHANHVLLMQGLAAKGWQIRLITLVRDASQFDAVALAQAVPGLQPAQVLYTKLNYPLLLLRHLLPWPVPLSGVARAVANMARAHPSAVFHLEGIGLLPLVAGLRGRVVVVTTTDAWSLRQQRLAARAPAGLRRWFLRTYAGLSAWAERRFLPLASAAQVVSPADAAYLRQQVPAARVHCIPIALPVPPQVAAAWPGGLGQAVRTVLFWGDIRVAHIADGLQWLLVEVLPLVRLPAQWVVLGRGKPPAALQEAAPGICFVDWVQDIDAFLQSATLVVLPDAAGTGLKNRAIHAMACGVPVVGTPQAFEGFAAVDGQHAMVRATPQAFADAINELLADPVRARQMACQGRQFAVQGYSLDAVAAQWAALYSGALQRAGEGGLA